MATPVIAAGFADDSDNSWRAPNVLERFEPIAYHFTRKQWALLYLYYRKGLTQQAIATEMGLSPSSVSSLLKRAQAVMAKIDRELREEQLELARKYREKN
jgi:RNA polymerase sigma factor (sigma-70 family)